MNKKGITIIELLASLTLVSIVVLLLINVIFSLKNINSSDKYASDNEITRSLLIKNIENDFLELKLTGLDINRNEDKTIIKFYFEENEKELIIKKNSITYNNEEKELNNNNTSYSLKPIFEKIDIDNEFYLIKLNIPVLLNNKDESKVDDITLIYMDKIKENNKYPL